MLIVISVCSAISLLTVLMSCLCWKKKRQKNEWGGLDGMVTQKNPDENVNYFPSITVQTVPDGPVNNVTADNIDPITRLIVNPRRSLPDIPLEGEGLQASGEAVVYEPNGDNSSELYATVEPYANTAKNVQYVNGINSRPSISQHSSISQADDAFSPYAKVNYDKLKKPEHPYARVQNLTNNEQNGTSSDETTPTRSTERPSTSQNLEPIAPPRSRVSSVHTPATGDIPAASAVAGGIAASQELPYMTPPLVQPNFSGDSQDSQKGYTSISVREPLANIIAQTKDMNKGKTRRELDPHYSTVSDDSDEMYTTIQDPNNQVYTSGSETYAQIQPVAITVAAEVNPVPQFVRQSTDDDERRDDLYEPPPPPHSERRVSAGPSHSRQASSSSSIANLGSPKPEKRQANSPLPPPPPIASTSPELYPNIDKAKLLKNVDDMYAKVQKKDKKKQASEEAEADTSSEKSLKQTSSPSLTEENLYNDSSSYSNISKEHNYETLKKTARNCSDPGYEKLKLKDEDSSSEPGYASINGPPSLLSVDPGYEVLKNKACSESDPNYEELRHRTDSIGYSTISENTSSQSQAMDGYSVVNKKSKSEERSKTSSFETDSRDATLDEPNYESMPSEESDPNYAALKSTGSESDPNYESVNHNDPNYESVKYADVEEPPYEHLKEEDEEGSKSEPPYERLNEEDGGSKTETDSSGYEKIRKAESLENNLDSLKKEGDEDSIYQV